ncbi:MAG: DEAD/DEAH box helicase [Candidatus Dasytiphilus stammeri]
MAKNQTNFADLGLKLSLIESLKFSGYVKPSPIQVKCIPYLLKGSDVLGIAQTGSGKTAAFTLPLLNNLELNLKYPQALILTPTRELAIQVAEACTNLAKYLPGVHILAIYGGQRYEVQLRALRRGPHIIVGTPGRLLDHIQRGTLDLSRLRSLVLDEADEMLRMGFIVDVEKIFEKIPKEKQTALFSATMPEAIRRITTNFMKNPHEIRIDTDITKRPDISQSYWKVCGDKINALVRFLEVEKFDAVLIFVRKKSSTIEVAEILERRGYSTAALNGDMNQTLREQTLERFKDGRLEILIATDVAARGLDVERISLVVNYEIPLDAESYIHRIGRTGRAGRPGRALLFVENRERRLLHNIERLMKITIPEIELPSLEFISQRRLEKFYAKVQQQLESNDLAQYRTLLPKIQPDKNIDVETLAAALLKIAQGERQLILSPEKVERRSDRYSNRSARRERRLGEMDLYRIEVGRDDGVEVRHIVGAIANEGEINSRYIGNIKLFAFHSTIELPKGMPGKILQHFTRTRIFNKPINMQFLGDAHSLNNKCVNKQRHENSHRFNRERRGKTRHSYSSDRLSHRYS